MNRPRKYLLGLIFGLSLVLSALPGHAQDSDRLTATIPFDFVVGGKQLKAGDYVIESALDGRVVMLRSKRGAVQQIAFTVPIETNRTGNHERLLFRHDGDRYFLSQVWFSGDDNGGELIRRGQQKPHENNPPVSDQTTVGQ